MHPLISLLFLLVISLSSCAQLPENAGRSTSFAITDTADTKLGQAARRLEAAPSESAFLLLGNGLDAFVARAALAQNAEKSIDAQYYLLHDDKVGRLFVDQLLKAADRGVRVRLLIDDMDMEGRDSASLVLDAHPNIEVRLFNPFGRNTRRTYQYVTGFGKQTRRAHNKSFTVDSIATIVGGRNIGDEYFIADPEMEFLDLDVLAFGPVAPLVAGSFDQYWNHDLSYPISRLNDLPLTAEEINDWREAFNQFINEQADSIYVKSLVDSNLASAIKRYEVELVTAEGQVYWDHPDKLTTSTKDTSTHLINDLAEHLENVSGELIIISPYFIPGKSGVAYFKKLRDQGVRVVVLTNSLSSTDVSVVHAGYAKYRRALLKMGVELYELNRNLRQENKDSEKSKFYESKSSLHAKAFIIDRQKTFIGSLNLDARSVIQNTEIGIVIESEDIARRAAEYIDDQIGQLAFRLSLDKGPDGATRMVWHGSVDGKQTVLTAEPYTGFWQRFRVGLMRLLPIESQL